MKLFVVTLVIKFDESTCDSVRRVLAFLQRFAVFLRSYSIDFSFTKPVNTAVFALLVSHCV